MEDGVLLLGGLAFRVAVGGGEVGLGLGDCGPEEGAGVRAREVHGDVEVLAGDGHEVVRVALIGDEERGGLARVHLTVDFLLERLVARVLVFLEARVDSLGGSALRRLLDHFHNRLQERLEAAVFHLFTVVFVLVHRVVSRDDVFVVRVVRHIGKVESVCC